MKFFTPELLVRFRSADDDIADQANKEWERAIERYRRRFQRIRYRLPESLRVFDREQCLHDAEVFGPAWLPLPPLRVERRVVVLIAQQINTMLPETQHTLAILEYSVATDPVIEKPVSDESFRESPAPQWEYDEIDLIEPSLFSHEILFSDGRVVKMLFHDFRYHIALLILPTQTGQALVPTANRPVPQAPKPRKTRRRA
jgi:hypothetical protein